MRESFRTTPLIHDHCFADYFPLRAHNGSSRNREAQMITVPAPMRAFSVPGPWSRVPFIPRFFSQNPSTPHPPTLWKSFFDHFIPCNLQYINILHYSPVDEVVNLNADFHPFFGHFRGKIGTESAVFVDFFTAAANSPYLSATPFAASFLF
jgi:hypothetical protein